MPRFDVNNYVDVAERIEQFYAEYNDGRLITELVNFANWEGPQSQFIVHASAFVGDVLMATGLAEESFGPSGPNQTSALENAETSAIGRALANMGYQTTRDGKRQRPSREEMEKVERGTNVTTEATPLGDLMTVLMESGFTPAVQGDIIAAKLGRKVKNPAELTADEIPLAIDAIEGAIVDRDQLQS